MPDRKRGARSGRLRSAIEFLSSIPLGTLPVHAADSAPSHASATTGAAGDASSSAATGDGAGTGLRSSGLHAPLGIATAPSATAGTGSAALESKPAATPTGADAVDAAAEISVRVRGKPFRHITSRGQRSSVLFRDALMQEGVLDGRIIFARNKEYPSCVFSIIQYDAKVEFALLRDRQVAAANLLMGDAVSEATRAHWLRWKGTSYAKLLHAEHAPCSAERDETAAALAGEASGGAGGGAGVDAGHPEPEAYDPLLLDDPAIDLEKQRFAYNREGYMFSILAFRNERAQKDLINEKFARAHPWLDPGDGQGLTLTKIRSLKRRALDVWWGKGWEVSTVALGIVFFERLVFKRLVNKGNRKLAMACALLLAYKMNEAREDDESSVKAVVTELETAFSTPRKQILKAEFPVFTHLRLGTKVPTAHVAPHLARLLSAKGTTPAEFLGPALFDEYVATGVEEAAAAARAAAEGEASSSSSSSSSSSDDARSGTRASSPASSATGIDGGGGGGGGRRKRRRRSHSGGDDASGPVHTVHDDGTTSATKSAAAGAPATLAT